ncbi:alpha/beta hydrolase family esterase [Mongoliimonas terrestris]|uniref:alpha/beta hydrolase family esterase n=1 Tax=Mongoliimonas terrestris TaxID=1709001 RepID=UPI0009499EF7|nr:alpha/beta fold hydrolase [Mongoliimonas terrestris]
MGLIRIARLLAPLLLAGLTTATAAEEPRPPCGGPVPCAVKGSATYRIELPSEGRAAGVYLFFHGYKGSAEAQMRHRDLVNAAHDAGFAFAAVDGAEGTWAHPNAPSDARDEFAVTAAVLDDLQARFAFGPEAVVVGGFSQGASMAWYAVCRLGDRVAGAVTFAGVFWDPLPAAADCPAMPPPLVHFHGTADRTFPLAGRAIGSRWHQGDTAESLDVLKARAHCQADPAPPVTLAGIACVVSAPCGRGPVTFCRHDGGHEVRPAWLASALPFVTHRSAAAGPRKALALPSP